MNVLTLEQILLVQTSLITVGIPLKHVDRVLPLVLLRSIPQAPSWFSGFLNLAGENIPVVDLSLQLGLDQPNSYTLETPMIIVSIEEKQAGFIVQEVLGVRHLKKALVNQTELFQNDTLPFLGIAHVFEGDPVLILNPQSLLNIHFGKDHLPFEMDLDYLTALKGGV